MQDIQKRVLSNEVSINEILDSLDELAELWAFEGGYYKSAKNLLINENKLSKNDIESTLKIIPTLFKKENLIKRIKAEFGCVDILNDFIKSPNQDVKVHAQSLGAVLHVTAGNVFLGVIDSLLMGLLTKNINIIKLSSNNLAFPKLFCDSLLAISSPDILCNNIAFLSWRGGDKEFEKEICKHIDAVMVWGGEESILAYKSYLGVDQKLIDYGPKLSFGVLFNDYLKENPKETYRAIAQDFITWRQSACSNAQTYFIQDSINEVSFLRGLKEELDSYEVIDLDLSDNAQAERLKEKERLIFSSFKTGIDSVYNKNYMLHYKGDSKLDLSVLYQTLNINTFKSLDDLKDKIIDKKYYLQTCGLGLIKGRSSFVLKFSALGIKRFTQIGKMTHGHDGAPHDGRFSLRELVDFINDEDQDDFVETIDNLKKNTPYYRKNKNASISSKELLEYKIHKSTELINKNSKAGFYFTSGGSTGEAKYCDYSYEDFDRVTDKLAANFKSLGLSEKDTAANLFMSGNMWSSFISTLKVLEKVRCRQLPIGGSLSAKDTLKFIKDFNANVLIGVPTKILAMAKIVKEKNLKLPMKMIFYAGERFSQENYSFVMEAFECDKLLSAGYAGVDCGLIAVQSSSLKKDEHELIDGVKITKGSHGLLVTSSLRENMPVINYELQDNISFIDSDKRVFTLNGRVDNVIQLWGCRFSAQILKKSIENEANSQFVITRDEKLILINENKAINTEKFSNAFLSYSDDVRKTINLEFLINNVSSITGPLKVNKKTGKTPLVLDERF